MNNGSKIPSGVPGLDNILMGGFIPAGFYLIQGDPGSGKTTIALQYSIGRAKAGERILYVSLTETKQDLQNAAESHNWNIAGIDICDLSRAANNLAGQAEISVFHPSETELGETTQAILDEVERLKPAHVIFDGLSELRLLAGDPLRYRRQLLSLKNFFYDRKITVMALDDRTFPMGDIQPESLVGGNIVLERHLPVYGRSRRKLFVTKVRGANFREGYHDYELIQGGMIVHPRLVAAEHHDRFSSKMSASGIEHLDIMLCGGLSVGTTTLLLGPAGVGKSTVSMQFVLEALRKGERAAVYIFDEVLGTMVERTEKLCAGKEGGLRAFIEEGLLHVQQIDPAEMSAGAFSHEVRRAVDEGAKIVVIDSLNGYLNAMPEERFLTAHLHEMFAYLNQKGITTILVVAQHGLMTAGAGNSTDIDVSYLADTVLLFRYFETNAEIKQAISILKKRTGKHERTIRQLVIDEHGVKVGNPLKDFFGIMTGVPQYKGKTEMVETRTNDKQSSL
ncbi:MAG TPA: ATPase domain-containing protein [Verrucomicrobiae bacterium]|jgi:circadian clock protein KaiC|nr:ATPase domain-containing protein [Verrucomicrobiae bacterium]